MSEIVVLKLLQLEHGLRHINVEKLYTTHNAKLGLVQLSDGKWYSLNYRSCDPCRLSNREERSAWARAQGLLPKDVENYVRRRKRAEAAETMQQNESCSIDFLKSRGYTVTKENGNAKP